jgi:hypothetical protein
MEMAMVRAALLVSLGIALANCSMSQFSLWPSPPSQTASVSPAPPVAESDLDAAPADGPRTAQAVHRSARKSASREPARDVASTGSVNRLSGPAPVIGSPEWNRQQAENERKEKRLDSLIRGICSGC